MSSSFTSISVLGGGAWGTALATLSANNGVETLLWSRNALVVDDINTHHENRTYLPGVSLPENLRASQNLEAAAQKQAMIVVVPAQYGRDIYRKLAILRPEGMPVAIGAKGIEQHTLMLMPEVLRDAWPAAIPAMISGPSFAHDVAAGKPTAVTLGDENAQTGRQWLQTIGARHFRPYLNTDLTGAALGGAIKNVLAIAAGIVDGMQLGQSAHAALIARGFAEFQRLGLALGARAETMAGLSGLGDLILTAGSDRSRNMSLGQKLGQGESLEHILSARHTVSEGVATATAVRDLAARHQVEMPVCGAVASIVDGTMGVGDAITALMARPFKTEG